MSARASVLWLVLLLAVAPARAHDTGFGHSRRTLFVAPVADGYAVTVRLSLDAAEALLLMTRMDRDHDGAVSPAEREAYGATTGAAFAARLLATDTADRPLPVRFVAFAPGETLALIYQFRIDTAERQVFLTDSLFPHRHGWVSVRSAPGVEVKLGATTASHAGAVRVQLLRPGPEPQPRN